MMSHHPDVLMAVGEQLERPNRRLGKTYDRLASTSGESSNTPSCFTLQALGKDPGGWVSCGSSATNTENYVTEKAILPSKLIKKVTTNEEVNSLLQDKVLLVMTWTKMLRTVFENSRSFNILNSLRAR